MSFFTTSTTTGGWHSFSYSMPEPPPPPYHGSYLPAVIHVFDYEVDLENAGVAALEKAVASLEQEGARLNNLGTQACVSLEKHIPEKLATMRELMAKFQVIQALIRDEMAKREAPAIPETLPDHTPEPDQETGQEHEHVLSAEHDTVNKRMAAQMTREQNKYKKASAKVKALHRKIMQLTHENKWGKVEHLYELYEMANAARTNNDEHALKGILQLAQQYHSPQGKLAIMNFLKTRKAALQAHYRNLEDAVERVKGSPTFMVHKCLEQGETDYALDLFTRLVDNNAAGYRQAIAQAELQLSALTGTFSDGSTHTTLSI